MKNDSKMEYRRDEHRVHMVVFHLVWTPKRRKPVLVGCVSDDCKAMIEKKCQQHGWEILQLAVLPDHVHLFVRAWPETSASQVARECKGFTSRELRSKYPDLKRKLPSLWTRSFFAATAGNVSQETINKYIAAQRGL